MTHVSAIVPTKNRSRQLRTALASIRAIEGPDLQIELIVVDNGSTDDTEHVAQEFDARFLRAAQPGAAAARNVGLEAATAEFVAFLDDDDAWLPEHVRPQLARRPSPSSRRSSAKIVLTNDRPDEHGEPYPRQVDPTDRLFPWFLGHIPQVGATVALVNERARDGRLFRFRYGRRRGLGLAFAARAAPPRGFCARPLHALSPATRRSHCRPAVDSSSQHAARLHKESAPGWTKLRLQGRPRSRGCSSSTTGTTSPISPAMPTVGHPRARASARAGRCSARCSRHLPTRPSICDNQSSVTPSPARY